MKALPIGSNWIKCPLLGLGASVITWKQEASYKGPTTTGSTGNAQNGAAGIPPPPNPRPLPTRLRYTSRGTHSKNPEVQVEQPEFHWPTATLVFPTALGVSTCSPSYLLFSMCLIATSINDNDKKPSQHYEPPDYTVPKYLQTTRSAIFFGSILSLGATKIFTPEWHLSAKWPQVMLLYIIS